jgi:hypothetical protein
MLYSEDIDAFRLVDENGKQTGTRSFFDDSNGPEASLPAYGDSFPDIGSLSFPDCTLRTIEYARWKNQASKYQYVCKYSSTGAKTDTPSQDEDTDEEDYKRQYSSSGQMVTLGGSPTFSGTGNEFKGKPFTKMQPTLSKVIYKVFENEGDMHTLIKAHIGNTNLKPFEGEDAADTWLFNSFRSEEYWDSEAGDVRWGGFMTFEMRIANNVVIPWNHEWDVTAQAWADLSIPRYAFSDLNLLLA